VLSIAAARLGFAPVVAIDDDPAAIEAAKRNARANNVSVDVRLGDALAESVPGADAALANVSGGFVEQLAPRISAKSLIVSGYLESERPFPVGFEPAKRLVEDGWAADLLQRRK
jgi:ribosomal protein L11 methyltransferase